MMAIAARHDDGGECRPRDVREERAEGQQGHDDRDRPDDGHELRLAAQGCRHRGAAGTRGDREALRDPGGQVREAQSQQLLVGIDAVAVAGGDRASGEDVVGVADERDADGDGKELPEVASGHVGQLELGEPAGDVADQRDATRVESEDADDDRRGDDAEQRAWHLRRGSPEHEDERERAPADSHRLSVHVAELADELGDAGEEVVRRDRDAGDAGDLAADQDQADPGDVADQNRLRQHRREEPQASDGTRDADPGDDQRQRRHQRDVPRRVSSRDRRDPRGSQDRRARLWPDPEVTAGPHDRVHQQRPDHGVEAELRWQAGQLGVGHRLRDEHRADRQARRQVRPQPRPLVVAQHAEARQQPRRTRTRVAGCRHLLNVGRTAPSPSSAPVGP